MSSFGYPFVLVFCSLLRFVPATYPSLIAILRDARLMLCYVHLTIPLALFVVFAIDHDLFTLVVRWR